MTSVKNISKYLIHAGADWIDEEVVVDQGLVTSLTPEDLPAFNDKIVRNLRKAYMKVNMLKSFRHYL